jgi:hypothetical protein
MKIILKFRAQPTRAVPEVTNRQNYPHPPSLSSFYSSEFFARSDFFLCRYHLLRQQEVAKWMPTKEKGTSLRAKKFASGKRTLATVLTRKRNKSLILKYWYIYYLLAMEFFFYTYCYRNMLFNFVPRLFALVLWCHGHLLRTYPGIVWSRVSQNLGVTIHF